MSRPLVWLYGLNGDRQVPLHDLVKLEVEERLNDLETLRFTIRSDDPKASFVVADQICEYEDRTYRIEEIEEKREGRIALVKVYAEASWMDLGKRSKPDTFTVLAQTSGQGLGLILVDSGWTVGTVDGSSALYSMEDRDASILQLVRRWASITGLEVEWDTLNRTVGLRTSIGQDRGVGFRWGYNLLSVERRFRPPIATRLYAFGANNLDIRAANPTGEDYVEDYSWYIGQGLTFTQASDLYRKDQIWVDNRFISPINLYDAALRRIAALAQPLITYELSVAELSRLTASPADDVAIGDIVRVRDRDFNIDLTTRVVRLVKDELEPQRNQVELDYLEPGLADQRTLEAGSSRSINYEELVILTDYNDFGQTIGVSTQVWASIQITITGVSVIVLGGTFVGVGIGEGEITLTATANGERIGGEYRFNFSDGEPFEFSWPTWDELPAGTYIVDWRAQVTSGAGGVQTQVQETRGWLLARGAVGIGVAGLADQQIIEEIDNIESTAFEPLTEVEWVVTIETPPPPGAELEDELDALTEIEDFSEDWDVTIT
jgi:phage minor structural protein